VAALNAHARGDALGSLPGDLDAPIANPRGDRPVEDLQIRTRVDEPERAVDQLRWCRRRELETQVVRSKIARVSCEELIDCCGQRGPVCGQVAQLGAVGLDLDVARTGLPADRCAGDRHHHHPSPHDPKVVRMVNFGLTKTGVISYCCLGYGNDGGLPYSDFAVHLRARTTTAAFGFSYKGIVQRAAIHELMASLYPGAIIERICPFGVDVHGEHEHEATEKGIGYGKPVRVVGRDQAGKPLDLVVHTAASDIFGHDRRADRAAEMLLAFDTFSAIPRQARAVDVGAITKEHAFRSLRDCDEFYLVTEYREGRIYAEDLRRLAHQRAEARDQRRVDVLADYLSALHREVAGTQVEYVRSIRDLIGSGEGIFGIADGYPEGTSAQLMARVREIECACVDWRWRLRGRHPRCRRIHGDFHPFNLLFDDRDELAVLDAARGCLGDPADDAVCIAVNFVFFAMGSAEAWSRTFEPLWKRFWSRYLDATKDAALLEVAPPFLAWRVLVLANPRWYPALGDEQRLRLLSLAETALREGHLDLDMPGALF